MKKNVLLLLLTFLVSTLAYSGTNQGNYRWRDDSVGESANSGWLTNENTNIDASSGTNIRLRVELYNTNGNEMNNTMSLYYSTSSDPSIGTWTVVSTSSANAFKLSETNHYNEGPAPTNLLTNTSTYASAVGYLIESSTEVQMRTPVYSSLEVEYCIQPTVNASIGTTYFFALKRIGGQNINPPQRSIPGVTIIESQTIIFNELSNKTFGDAAFTVSATGGASGNPVVFTSSNNNIATCSGTNGSIITVINAGVCDIYANQAGNTIYSAANQVSQSLKVTKATPTVTEWPLAASISYGDDLSSATLSGGAASVSGSFGFDDITMIPNVGTTSAALTFTPSDAANYNTVAGNVDVTVTKATPVVTVWPSAAAITYGDDLSAATLSGGTASVAGSFAFDDNTITPDAGIYSAGLIFTPSDAINYHAVAGNIDLTVAKVTPTVTNWPSAIEITYGDDLSSATLSGGTASVAGSFAYNDNTITPDAGAYSAGVTFTPSVVANYNTVEGTTNVIVAKKLITITADADQSKAYGEIDPVFTFTSSEALVNGDVYTGSLSRIAGENVNTYAIQQGSLALSSNYDVSFAGADFEITKATPSFGKLLSGINIAQDKMAVVSSIEGMDYFYASYSVDGDMNTRWSSEYTDNEWIYIDLGQSYAINQVILKWEKAYGKKYTIDISDDASNWTSIFSEDAGNGQTDDILLSGAGRYLRMNGIQRATDFGYSLWEFEIYGAGSDDLPIASNITYGEELSSATLIGGTASVPGSFAYSDGTQKPNVGTNDFEVLFTPTDTDNYNTVMCSVSVMVAKATPTITVWPSAAGITYGADLSAATLSEGTASIAGSFAYNDNTITPNSGVYSAALTFTPDNISNYHTVAENIDVTVAKAILTAKAEDQIKAVGEANPTLTVTLTGFVLGEDESYVFELPQAACSADASSVAGDYPITVSGGSDNNYDFYYVTGNLTIETATAIAPTENVIGKVWPNPTKGNLFISNNLLGKPYVIYSLTGSMVMKGSAAESILDISELTPGIYMVVIDENIFRVIKN